VTEPGPLRHVVVIGGGPSGLASAYELARAGQRVTVLEAARDFGGLASSIQLEGQPVERFYHFFCRSDHDLIQLIEELGLSDRLHWKKTSTCFYHHGQLYSFATPFDLARFSAVPWLQRLRFGMHIVRSRFRLQWRWLDQIPAKPWLIENIGEEAYNVIWHPLLRIKFGDYYDKISAAWVYHRIWRVARSRQRLWERDTFGYLTQGTATLIDGLVNRLRRQPTAELRSCAWTGAIQVDGGRVTGVRVDDEFIACDAVISTVALPGLAQLLPSQLEDYAAKLRRVSYIGIVCALFSLKYPLSSTFWMNINDPRISFNGLIELTNLNQNLRAAGLNVLYIPFYLPTSEPRYSFSDDDLATEYASMLRLINPAFGLDWIKERYVFRASYAQPICVTNFVDLMPEPRSPVCGLYVTDSTQFYPEDRTIGAAIRLGRKVARMIVAGTE